MKHLEKRGRMKLKNEKRDFLRCLCLLGMAFAVMVILGGCSNDALDPSQIGRFRPVPVVNVILDSLGVADEPNPVYAGAEDPRPEDVIAYDQDYVFGTGDVIRISIFELRQSGVPFVNDFVVTETGNISIPDVGVVRAAGLTEVELEEEIKQILSPTILLNPSVTAVLIQSESRLFSIYGNGIGRPGRYEIPRKNFRLSEAVALAGGVAEFNLSYIYVTRQVTGEQALANELPDSERDISEPYIPQRSTRQPVEERPASAAQPQTEKKTSEGVVEVEEPAIPEEMEIREVEPGEVTPEEPAEQTEEELLEMIAPYAKQVPGVNPQVISVSDVSQSNELDTLTFLQGADMEGRVEWEFRNGRWVPVQVGGEPVGEEGIGDDTEQPSQPQTRTLPEKAIPLGDRAIGQYGWSDIGGAGLQTRTIRIPVDSLVSGDPRYDIIIQPGDSVSVPVDLIGEFWVMGNVNAQGPISITGRPLTLKMAIASAGGLGPLAYPKKVEVIRRIGRNKEEIVMVDLEKIAKGQQPDFFIKPYDLINVGTHGTSRWMAVLRNAFRAEYGFGFTYSRNFAVEDFGNRIGPKWDWDDITSIF